MNILSLFGGIECGRVAIERLGIPVDKYFSSEIDPYAIKIAKANYPDIVHIGDIRWVTYYNDEILMWDKEWDNSRDQDYLWTIDLLIGGSPCQDLSIAKAWWKWLEWEKSGLFYEYVRILREVKPKYFLLENVASMKKSDRDEITRIIGVEPIMINSSLVSAQNRKRLYWFGKLNEQWEYETIHISQPQDKWILLRDILEDIPMDDKRWKPLDKKYLTDSFFEKIAKWTISLANIHPTRKAYPVTATYAWACPRDYLEKHQRELVIWQFRRWTNLRIHADQENTPTLTSNMGTGGNNVPVIITPEYYWRKLTPIECERLQTLTERKKRIECKLWKDILKSFANAEQKNLKLQNVVGNVESTNKQESVKYAEKNTILKSQKINSPALLNVRIDLEGKKLQLQIQNDVASYVKSVEWPSESPHQKKIENIALLSAGLFEYLEKIVRNGSEELQKNTCLSITQENGNYAVEIFGQSINESANVVDVNQIETKKQTTKSTISKAIENINPIDSIEKTLHFFVKIAIDLCIQNWISIENLSQINFEFVEGYTFGVSNSQRYKAIGNGWTIDVIAHILSFILLS